MSEDQPSKDGQFLLVVDLGANGGKRVFQSADELKTWLQAEQQFWSFLASVSGQDQNPGIGRARKSVFAFLTEGLNQVEALRNRPPAQHAAHLAEIRLHLESQANRPARWLCSGSPRGVFIKDLAGTDPTEAAVALAYFLGVEPIAAQAGAKLLRGAIGAALFEAGLKSAEPAARALEKVAVEWDERLTGLFDTGHASCAALGGEIDSAKAKSAEQAKTHDADILRHRDELAASIKRTRDDVDQLKKLLTDELALRAPRTYWTHKKWWHVAIAVVFGAAFLAGAWFGGNYLIGRADHLLSLEAAGKLEWYRRLAGLVLPALLLLWVLQLVARIMMSHLHLATDAAERATMIHTYLAMLQEQKNAVQESHRSLILTAIFRPATSGLIKGDYVGPSFLAQVTGLFQSRK